MATIATLTEDFEGGSNGALLTVGNSSFVDFQGTATATTPTFSTDAYEGSLAARFLPAGGTIYAYSQFAATPLVWVSFYIKITTLPSSNTPIFNFWNGASRMGDVRLQPGGTLQLRDGFSQQWVSSALTTGEWHRIAIKVDSGTALRLRAYSGADLDGSTPTQDSGDIAASTAGQAVITEFRFGSVSGSSMEYVMDRLRGDDSAEPAGVSAGATPHWFHDNGAQWGDVTDEVNHDDGSLWVKV
ncbi:MAG: hypothetical protein WBH03_21375 [Cyclobacteriaceae bacterium]